MKINHDLILLPALLNRIIIINIGAKQYTSKLQSADYLSIPQTTIDLSQFVKERSLLHDAITVPI